MKTHFSLQFLEDASETLKSIAHPARMVIVNLLHKHGSLTVTEIYEQMEIEQAVASHHLRILKNKGVVNVSRKGKNSVYSLSKDEFYDIIDILIKTL